jgi:hypothetical protein
MSSSYRLGIDYAWGAPIAIPALKRAGITFVGRYLSNDPSKNITRSEYEQLHANNIDVLLCWETTAERALAGEQAGRDDAIKAAAQRSACGIPTSQPIYFAIDFDATGPDVDAYFTGAASILGTATGAYGGYKPIKHLLDHHLIHHAWQTYAWSDGHWDPRARTRQYSNGHQLARIEVDYDFQLPDTPYIPGDERNWTHEYDRLVSQKRAPWRRQQLRRLMTTRRKTIWHLAQHTGWDTHNRRARWLALVNRTE